MLCIDEAALEIEEVRKISMRMIAGYLSHRQNTKEGKDKMLKAEQEQDRFEC